MIDVIIVEDEELISETLEAQLLDLSTEIRVLAVASSISEAIIKIDKLKPVLVFMDIVLSDGISFEIFEQIKYKDFKVIFITAHSEYAVQAFRQSALDYLIKPFTIETLRDALDRFLKLENTVYKEASIKSAEEKYHLGYNRILIPINSSHTLYNFSDIIRMEADSSYTKIFTTDGKMITVSKNLYFYETLLSEYQFCRVHNSHLINLSHIKKVNRGRTPLIIMTDGMEINVSVLKKEEFQLRIKSNFLLG